MATQKQAQAAHDKAQEIIGIWRQAKYDKFEIARMCEVSPHMVNQVVVNGSAGEEALMMQMIQRDVEEKQALQREVEEAAERKVEMDAAIAVAVEAALAAQAEK